MEEDLLRALRSKFMGPFFAAQAAAGRMPEGGSQAVSAERSGDLGAGWGVRGAGSDLVGGQPHADRQAVTGARSHRNFDPEGAGSVKADDLRERIEQLCDSGQKALVFSQFIDSDYGVGAIIRRLAGLNPLALTGSMSQNQREDVVRRFNEDPRAPVLVLSLRAGGVGLNLQAASYVFHFDRWWNPAVEDQATDRSHRLGQARPVHVYAYAIENSVEERILEILQAKRLLFSELVEGAGIDVGTSLTKEELLRVAGLPSSSQGDVHV